MLKLFHFKLIFKFFENFIYEYFIYIIFTSTSIYENKQEWYFSSILITMERSIANVFKKKCRYKIAHISQSERNRYCAFSRFIYRNYFAEFEAFKAKPFSIPMLRLLRRKGINYHCISHAFLRAIKGISFLENIHIVGQKVRRECLLTYWHQSTFSAVRTYLPHNLKVKLCAIIVFWVALLLINVMPASYCHIHLSSLHLEDRVR